MKGRASFQIPTPPRDNNTQYGAPYPLLSDDVSRSSTVYPPLPAYPTQPSAPYPPENNNPGRSDGSMPPPYPPSGNNKAGYRDSAPASHHHSIPRSASAANSTEDIRAKNLTKFIHRYEINKIFADRLRALKGCEIVFICDDSGSMNLELNDDAGPQGNLPTRWDELKRTVSIVVDVATTLDPDGVDVYFLNRPPMKNVRSSEELNEVFSIPPDGPTPIIPVLRQVLQDKRNQIHERKLVLLIATDGQPTDDYGNPEVEQFRQFLERERRPINKIPVTIIACTDDDDSMAYLNDWDDRVPNLDVVDDYQTELRQIRGVQGPNFPFSFGDYVMKILLGGVDPWFGKLDNEPIAADHPHHNRSNRNSTYQSLSRFSN